MKFFCNENQDTSFLSYKDAAREVQYSCMIPLKDVTNFFNEVDPKNIKPEYVNSVNSRKPIYKRWAPFPNRYLDPSESLVYVSDYNRGNLGRTVNDLILSEKAVVVDAARNYMATSVVDQGNKQRLNEDNMCAWMFYRWLENHLVNEEERFFNDDDYRFPELSDFLLPHHESILSNVTSLPRPYAQNHIPGNGVTTTIRNWLRNNGNENRIVSTHIGDEFFTINLGLDARILAYYANKEGIKPTCISSLF